MLQLNSLIVTLRQVTFMLQKQKAEIPEFDPWYAEWQDRMRADPLMKWLHDARTHVEKLGDLDLASTAKVTIIAAWIDGPNIEFEVQPLLGPREIASSAADLDLPGGIREEGVLRVERRWVSKDLPGHELTAICAHGYGVLATMLAEAHARLGLKMRTFSRENHDGRQHVRTDHLGGRLPCMTVTDDDRTAYLHLASGDLIEFEVEEIDLDFETDGERFRRHAEEALISPSAFAPGPNDDAFAFAARVASVARRMLAHDGYHRPIAFMLNDRAEPVGQVALDFRDQAAKYLAMRRLAQHVDRAGATAVVIINEIWQAEIPVSDLTPERFVRAGKQPNRTEALLVQVATADGRTRSYTTAFTRDGNGQPVLADQDVHDAKSRMETLAFEPIRAVWDTWA